jgi:hypothetical protein
MDYKNNIKSIISLLALLILTPFVANASTTSGVSSASVTEGKTTIDMRVGYSEGDDASSQDERLRTRIHIDHGITPYYAFRVMALQDNRKFDSYEHDELEFVNRFYLLKHAEYGFDFGTRLSYKLKDGDKKPDSLSFRTIEVFSHNSLELRLNQTVSHDVGKERESGISFEHRAQLTYEYFSNHQIGIESFNDFGNLSEDTSFDDQSHTVGPVIKGKLFGLGYETGYRAGISDGAIDHSFKLFLKKSF